MRSSLDCKALVAHAGSTILGESAFSGLGLSFISRLASGGSLPCVVRVVSGKKDIEINSRLLLSHTHIELIYCSHSSRSITSYIMSEPPHTDASGDSTNASFLDRMKERVGSRFSRISASLQYPNPVEPRDSTKPSGRAPSTIRSSHMDSPPPPKETMPKYVPPVTPKRQRMIDSAKLLKERYELPESLAVLRILVAHANTCVGRMSLKQITTRTLQRFRKIRNEESLLLMTPTSISTQILGPIFLCILTHRSYHLPRFMLVHLTCTYPISLFYAFSTCAEIYLHDSKR